MGDRAIFVSVRTGSAVELDGEPGSFDAANRVASSARLESPDDNPIAPRNSENEGHDIDTRMILQRNFDRASFEAEPIRHHDTAQNPKQHSHPATDKE
jgi:hypothetical protein